MQLVLGVQSQHPQSYRAIKTSTRGKLAGNVQTTVMKDSLFLCSVLTKYEYGSPFSTKTFY